MVAIVASIILLAATPTPSPARVTLNDLVGMWITVRGDCRKVSIYSAPTEITECGASIASQMASGFCVVSDKIVVRHDPKKSDEEIITVLRFEPYFDRTISLRPLSGWEPREMDEVMTL